MSKSPSLRDSILNACFLPYEGRLASGQWANNKIDIELLNVRASNFNNPEYSQLVETRERVIEGLGNIALKNKVDFVMGVPNGANWLAEAVHKKLKLCIIRLVKQPNGDIQFGTDIDCAERIQWTACKGMLIEDVVTTGGNIRAVLEHEKFQRSIAMAASVFDRSNPDTFDPLSVPHETLVKEYIPANIPIDDPRCLITINRAVKMGQITAVKSGQM